MRFAIFGNSHQKQKAAQTQLLLSLLAAYNDEVYIDRTFFHFITDELNLPFHPAGLIDHSLPLVDMAISLGGDGTFLRTASRIGASGIPIVGINTGRLGFLADVSADEMDVFFQNLHQGHYQVRERSVLQLILDHDCSTTCFALNEVAILKHDSSSMIAIHTYINKEKLVTYMADGLIAATPTGSTGYSLSVGGPIIYPLSDVVVLTPVAPHSLNVRPLVLSDDKEIDLQVESRSHSFLIAMDGQSQSYVESTQLTIRKAPYKIKVVKQEGNRFFHTLQEKMMWGADRRD